MAEPDLYIAKEGAWIQYEGGDFFIAPGTIVRAGHPLLDGGGSLFEPLIVHYDVEPAKDESKTAKTSPARK